MSRRDNTKIDDRMAVWINWEGIARMLGSEALELADSVGVSTQLEIGIDPRLERDEP